MFDDLDDPISSPFVGAYLRSFSDHFWPIGVILRVDVSGVWTKLSIFLFSFVQTV